MKGEFVWTVGVNREGEDAKAKSLCFSSPPASIFTHAPLFHVTLKFTMYTLQNLHGEYMATGEREDANATQILG